MSRVRLIACHALFGWLNFALVVPTIYLLLGLPLVMREQGWSGTDIGLFQLAGLPAVFKFALAWPVQHWRPGSTTFRGWTFWLCLALALVLLVIARQGSLAQRHGLFALALGASLLATWADVPLNALAIRVFPAGQRARAGAVRSTAMFLGAVTGGGLILILQARLGWSAPFWVMAALLASGALALPWLAEPPIPTGPTAAGRTGWLGYFRQPAAGLWTALLLGSFPFIGAAWLYLKPLLLDLGLPAETVAWIAGVGGGLAGGLASLATGYWLGRAGVAGALPWLTGYAALALAALAALTRFDSGLPGLMLGAALVATAMGGLATLSFTLMMSFARQHHHATDYGVQASLFTLARLAVPVAAGVLLDRVGYPGMLSLLALALTGSTLLACHARRGIASVVASGAAPHSRATSAGSTSNRSPTRP